MHHHPQPPVLVHEQHQLGVVSPVRVFRLHPHSPAARPHLLTNQRQVLTLMTNEKQVHLCYLEVGGGQLGVLRAVEDDQRSVLGPRNLVVHHQPLQIHHEVNLEAGGQLAEAGPMREDY